MYRKKKLAFLDLMLEIEQKDPEFTHTQIREEVDTFMFEAHDTTSSGLAFAIYSISRNPEVQVSIYIVK